jgi:hypothetical protein
MTAFQPSKARLLGSRRAWFALQLEIGRHYFASAMILTRCSLLPVDISHNKRNSKARR